MNRSGRVEDTPNGPVVVLTLEPDEAQGIVDALGSQDRAAEDIQDLVDQAREMESRSDLIAAAGALADLRQPTLTPGPGLADAHLLAMTSLLVEKTVKVETLGPEGVVGTGTVEAGRKPGDMVFITLRRNTPGLLYGARAVDAEGRTILDVVVYDPETGTGHLRHLEPQDSFALTYTMAMT